MRSSIEVSRALGHGLEIRDWHLATQVREPIARNVSAFFQNLRRVWVHQLPPEPRALCLRLLDQKSAAGPDDVHAAAAALVVQFQGRYRREFTDHWFDEEMKGVFGIDVFATPFPRERGWQLYRAGRVRLLLLRLENLAGAFDPAVREWLADSPWHGRLEAAERLELRSANEADTKNYALIYREFRQQLALDPALIAQEYATRTATHFYSPEELRGFASKWRKTPEPR